MNILNSNYYTSFINRLQPDAYIIEKINYKDMQ